MRPPPPCQSQPAALLAPPSGAGPQRHRPPNGTLRRAEGAREGGPSPASANQNPRCKSRARPASLAGEAAAAPPAVLCPCAPRGLRGAASCHRAGADRGYRTVCGQEEPGLNTAGTRRDVQAGGTRAKSCWDTASCARLLGGPGRRCAPAVETWCLR